MSSNELSWTNVYWPLVTVALNTMSQPCGQVCGFDESLGLFLRSSPIVCIGDILSILPRWIVYTIKSKSIFLAAKHVLTARGYRNPEPDGVILLLKIFLLVFGVIFCFLKLIFCVNIQWTQTWAYSYIASFVIVTLLVQLSKFAESELQSEQQDQHSLIDFEHDVVGSKISKGLKMLDGVLGNLAVLFQLGILAKVDFAVHDSDDNLVTRSKFHILRFGCLALGIFVHFVFVSFQAQKFSLSISLSKQVCVLCGLVTIGVLFILDKLNLKNTTYFFLYSLAASLSSWLLYWIPASRRLICPIYLDEKISYQNVIAFDFFFFRIFLLSLFWYWKAYNPKGTWEFSWANFFG